MKLEILNDPQEYRRIHQRVFNRTDFKVPPVVIVGRNDNGDIVGFISGFWNNDDSFYIQFAGVLPEYQKGPYLRYLSNCLDNNTNYDMAVENTNTVTLKTVLSIGFIPIGYMSQEDKNFVMLKRKKHG